MIIVSVARQLEQVITVSSFIGWEGIFFGPNTLVSLETWRYKKPLIYNKKLSDCPSGTAILIDPKDPRSVSNAIIDVIDNKFKDKFISNDISQLRVIEQLNKDGYGKLNIRLRYLKN